MKVIGYIINKRNLKTISFYDLISENKKYEIVVKDRDISFKNSTFLEAEVKLEEGQKSKYLLLNYKILAQPIKIDSVLDANVEVQLKKRVLYLRQNLEAKSKIFEYSNLKRALGNYLYKKGYFEFETRILTSKSEEGANQFEVKFKNSALYLSQSPQIFKQAIIGAGVNKYFQFAKCFRFEDLRGHRQFEFTQLDVEVSEGSFEDIKKVILSLIRIGKRTLGVFSKQVVKILTYEQAIKKYGFEYADIVLDTRIKGRHLQVLKDKIKIKELEEDKSITFVTKKRHLLIPLREASPLEVVQKIMKYKDGADSLLFIKEFPQYNKDGLSFENSPFNKLKENGNTESYDLVYNGIEVLSGAKRENEYEAFKDKFNKINKNIPSSLDNFAELMKEALPSSIGFAFGLERLCSVILGLSDLREIIFFPRSKSGKSYIDNSREEL